MRKATGGRNADVDSKQTSSQRERDYQKYENAQEERNKTYSQVHTTAINADNRTIKMR